MQSHNRLFMVPNYAEEQIKRFYRVPEPDTPKQFIKFRYTAEILERISTNPAMRSNLEHQSIGSIMSRLKFPKGHRKKGNGWYVVALTWRWFPTRMFWAIIPMYVIFKVAFSFFT